MPKAPASNRRGIRALEAGVIAGTLDMGKTLERGFAIGISGKHAFSVSQCLGRIKVLPLTLADFQRTQATIPNQLPHAIRERAVSVFGCGFKPVKQGWA